MDTARRLSVGVEGQVSKLSAATFTVLEPTQGLQRVPSRREGFGKVRGSARVEEYRFSLGKRKGSSWQPSDGAEEIMVYVE